MKHFLTAPLLGLSLTGCATIGGGKTLKINTAPPGALVTLEGGAECETPCMIKLDKPHRATIAKAGFVSLDVLLSPSRRSVTVPLELAAASTDVDAEALPEID
ncbi:PEGA domain-containing protein [Hyphococcus sp.]|uniref:PEGA domain-containing protein n=1 Tax=Hyphococcus sp. TaxID=2038636 RepID=UPI00375383A5